MARDATFRIVVNVDPLNNLADRLASITPAEMGKFVVDAINETTDSAYELGRKRILSGINLTDEYVQRKMQVEHATEKNPTATITAFGGRKYVTGLSHYGAMQETRGVNWTNAQILAREGRFGPWPGWTKRIGNAELGIAQDTKAAGRSVEVVRGRRKKIGPAFSIPGKKDADGNLVVFTRTPSGKTRALSGPSVYQLFRTAARHIEGQVGDDLEQSIIDAAERRLREELL